VTNLKAQINKICGCCRKHSWVASCTYEFVHTRKEAANSAGYVRTSQQRMISIGTARVLGLLTLVPPKAHITSISPKTKFISHLCHEPRPTTTTTTTTTNKKKRHSIVVCDDEECFFFSFFFFLELSHSSDKKKLQWKAKKVFVQRVCLGKKSAKLAIIFWDQKKVRSCHI